MFWLLSLLMPNQFRRESTGAGFDDFSRLIKSPESRGFLLKIVGLIGWTIGDAPQYFGSQALAWVKAHSGDPRGAELLGFAFRAMRNGCNLEQSAGLRHEVFNALHAKYGQSEWARRYARFESDSQ